MKKSIFLIQEDARPHQLQPQDFLKEEDLQILIADNPSLLTVETTDGNGVLRWLLVERESSIPDDQSDSRFSVDILLLDQDGIPTFVEVKRASDTRGRREVVAQMLDYASHAAAHWDGSTIMKKYYHSCNELGRNAEEELVSFVCLEDDPGDIWERCDQNLKDGKVRMLFVSDCVGPELRRIVGFLNRQMSPAEVLAVELKVFQSGKFQVLVPDIYGMLTDSERRKARRGGLDSAVDETTFFQKSKELWTPGFDEFALEVLALAKQEKWNVTFNIKGNNSGIAVRFPCTTGLGAIKFLNGLTISYDRFWLGLAPLRSSDTFADEEKRLELMDKLSKIVSWHRTEKSVNGYPTVYYKKLNAGAPRKECLELFKWIGQQLNPDAT